MTILNSLKSRSWVLPTRWIALCAATVLAGCAHLSPQTPEQQVQQRATARWQALLAGQYDKAYTYLTPGYRAIVTPEKYRGRIGSAVKWVDAKVNTVSCKESDKCDVQIQLDFQPVMSNRKMASYSTYPQESWVFEDGQWWFFQPITQ